MHVYRRGGYPAGFGAIDEFDTRAEILQSVFQTNFEGYERTVDVHIKNIRKALEPDPSRPVYIQTVWGVGYRMAEDPG